MQALTLRLPSLLRVAAVALVFVLGATAGRAQPGGAVGPVGMDPAKALTQLRLARWSTDEGLPQGTASSVAQTPDGYLWVGTQEGLARFDGLRFTVFDRTTGALPHNHVSALAVDPAGGLWVGTMGGGVVRYARGAFAPFPLADRLPPAPVRALLADRRGGLWIAVAGHGLLHYAGGRLTTFGPREGLAGDVVALHEDGRGRLWAGLKAGGVVRVLAGARPSFPSVPALRHTHAAALESDGRHLWVGTREHGLFRVAFGDGAVRAYTAADGLPVPGVLALRRDDRGSLWLGLDHGGIARLHAGRFAARSVGQGLAHDVVRALAVDREGNVWAGTNGGGLHRLADGAFTPYTTHEGLGATVTTAVYEDRSGAVWIGTEGGGATRLARGVAARTFAAADGLPGPTVYGFAETPDGSLWAGGLGGLARFQGGRFRPVPAADGLPEGTVYGLHTAADGALYVATGDGLAVLRDGRFRRYTTADGLSSNLVTAVEDDARGDVWVGTYDGGLNVLRGGRVVARFDEAHGLRSKTVLSLYADAEGDVWVGTNDGGLHRVRGGRIAAFGAAEGFPSDKVFAVVEDGAGRLWMSSNRGLFAVPKRDLHAVAAGARPRVAARLYDRRDGLPSAEFTGGVQPAGWRGRDGTLWFPTVAGAASIHPDRIRRNGHPPAVLVERLLADGVPVALGPDAEVAPGPQTFEFDFVGISLSDPERVRYRYRLDGVDAGWVEAGARREAYYTNLPPGVYTFQVLAQNGDGVWSPRPAVVTFRLRPFFYQTGWFYALVALALAGALVGLYRWRVRHLRRRQAELEGEVAARTHELREERDRVREAYREAERQRAAAEGANAVIAAQADQLREMDRVKTRFFNNLSHEFRTPLTLNIGPMENALTGLYGPVSDELQGQLSVMLRNARRLLRLINQLLDLAKLDAGQAKLQTQQGDLVAFVEGVVLAFTPFADHKRIALAFAPATAAFPAGFDPGAVEKVLYNLLSNAVKFTPEGGRITVRFRPLPTGAEIAVEDSGMGIPADELPHIFDRFRQVEGAASRVQEGTGIGLALVQDLVALHGGAVEVASTPGAGTTFRVTLRTEPAGAPVVGDGRPGPPPVVGHGPAVETALFEEPEPTAADLARPGAPLVLVVDDNRDVRDFMVRCLRDRYALRVAVDGEDALAQARAHRPALIVSDVSMPRLDGYDLCRAVKADEALAHTPVVLVTSKASSEERIEGLEAGADDYVAKPFNARELLARVDNLLTLREQQRALGETNDRLARSNAALREANELKSRFLHIAAHDLKTPLSGIRGCAQVLTEEIGADGVPREMLGLIVGSVDRMVGLITEILEAEALDGGRLEFETEPLDLAVVAAAVVAANEPLALAKGQHIRLAVPDGAALVTANEPWLRTALENLVSNAVKYSPHGRTIEVRVEVDAVGARCAVRDEGPGILEHERPLLFERFKRLSARPTGGESSNGLGLSIAHEIVAAHGGHIAVESTPGAGSTFIVCLPPAGAAAEAPLVAAAEVAAP